MKDTPYEAWQFGSDPNGLADLVLKGEKTGTASAYDLYLLDGEEVPKNDCYSVILDEDDQAVCIIQNTNVSNVPFKDIKEDWAAKEGEGDKNLAYWRNVHLDFFNSEFKDTGLDFNEDRLIVCEEFKVVFK